MKTYYGHAGTAQRPNSVMVRDSRPQMLAHHVRHNLGGFTWGSEGSGPGELARCILLDSFGIDSCPDDPKECQCHSIWVEPAYEAFEGDVISKFAEGEDWKLHQANVVDWVFDYLGQAEQAEKIPVEASL